VTALEQRLAKLEAERADRDIVSGDAFEQEFTNVQAA
jgi:hypothetical protein